jgi:PAS domain S-box-containing protein
MITNKYSFFKIVLLGLLLLCMLCVLGYSFINKTSVEVTLLLLFIISASIAIAIRFYLKKVETITSHYQKLFNSNPLAIYIMAKGDLKILGVNEAMIRLYGYTEEEFLKMTALDIRPKEDWEAFKAYVLKENKPPDETGISVHQKKNGEKFHVRFNFHAAPVIQEDAVLVMLTDIEKVYNDEKRINELLHLYEVVNKATHDVIWDYDLLNDKLYWMQGFEETYGYTKESSPHDFWAMKKVYHEDRAAAQYFFADIINKKRNDWLVEYRYICADESVKYVRDRGLILYNDAGEPVRLIGAMQDIDRQRRYEQQLIDQNIQLKEIAWINSHEVRRPLANIMGLANLIKEHPDRSEELSTLIGHLQKSSQELNNAVILINKQAGDKDLTRQVT